MSHRAQGRARQRWWAASPLGTWGCSQSQLWLPQVLWVPCCCGLPARVRPHLPDIPHYADCEDFCTGELLGLPSPCSVWFLWRCWLLPSFSPATLPGRGRRAASCAFEDVGVFSALLPCQRDSSKLIPSPNVFLGKSSAFGFVPIDLRIQTRELEKKDS